MKTKNKSFKTGKKKKVKMIKEENENHDFPKSKKERNEKKH